MDAQTLVSTFREFTAPHRVLDKHEDRIVFKLADVAWEYMQMKGKDLVNKANGRPVLFSYGSDGTPMLTRATVTSQNSSGQQVMRRAGRAAEFLLERAFLRTTSSEGRPLAVALFKPPVPLDAGKGALQVFTASCHFFPLLHKVGHRGVSVAHYCFDRALFAALTKKQVERHALYFERLGGPAGEKTGDLALSELKTWVVCTACSNHDAQNSLKWAPRTSCGGSDVVDKLDIAVEAVRNAYDLLCGHLSIFISQIVGFSEGAPDTPEVYHFWVSMGVLPEIAETLTSLGLWWTGTALQVSARHRGRADLFEEISFVLLSVFKFRKFTDSRRTTVGACSAPWWHPSISGWRGSSS